MPKAKNDMASKTNVLRLRTKASLDKDVQRKSALALLTQTIADVESGDIEEIVILAKCTNGDWLERCTPTNHFRSWIGGLQILISSWIGDYHLTSKV